MLSFDFPKSCLERSIIVIPDFPPQIPYFVKFKFPDALLGLVWMEMP